MREILELIPGTLEFDNNLLKKNLNKNLTKSIKEKEDLIKELEEDLECIVCMETSKAPIYCCQEQHLVCSDCRPRIRQTGQCPSCRVRYPGGELLRHRAAERTAVRLGTIREELRNLNIELENNLS